MRKAHKETLEQVRIRAGIDKKQMDHLSEMVSSTFGPIIISSMIERGLKLFREKNGKAKRVSKET